MDNFKPFLLVGLKNRAEYQVCHAAVGLVGDLARSLQGHFTPYAQDVMKVLFEDLSVSDTCMAALLNVSLLNYRILHFTDQYNL